MMQDTPWKIILLDYLADLTGISLDIIDLEVRVREVQLQYHPL
jgi:hypothetical protein